MSKGPGRIERVVEAAFAGEPDNAFTVEDLCDRAYPSESIEKKHRVSVIRAAKQVAKRRGNIDVMETYALGGAMVFFNRYDVMSYGMALLKCGEHPCYSYRNRDERDNDCKGAEATFRAMLAPDGDYHDRIAEGGHWWQTVQAHIAERDGDAGAIARLKAEREAWYDQERAKLDASTGDTTSAKVGAE
jgi:hypothetical protein